jgi:hypothetical protein
MGRPTGAVPAGQWVDLEFHADGLTPEWQLERFKDGTALSGKTAATLTILSAVQEDEGMYMCGSLPIVTDGALPKRRGSRDHGRRGR